jgi:SAM-dependent methyltransferase
VSAFSRGVLLAFSFGKNWKNFSKSINEKNMAIARDSLTEFLGLDSLRGKRFLDIGCGSGLFSKAAFDLGAKKVVSFDIDRHSVDCCRSLHEKQGKPKSWVVCEGSVLDKKFLSGLGKFEVVYSWGVLHHTGSMWEAIRNSAELVDKGGYYYIALYNKVKWKSRIWLCLKRTYNFFPWSVQSLMARVYIGAVFAFDIARLRNPFSRYERYIKRGMEFKTDVIDWLGGYPYEYATADEVVGFMKENFPDFNLAKVKKVNSLANNWFLFQKIGA